MQHRLWFSVILVIVTSGCSPYLYTNEIERFSNGVDQLFIAYGSGLAAVANDRAAAQRWGAINTRSKLAPTVECVMPVPGQPPAPLPCQLAVIGEPASGLTQAEQAAARAAPSVKALQDYAAALTAITNAKDRQALDVAQERLGVNLEDLATQAGGAAAAGQVTATSDLVSSIAAATFDMLRFRALAAGVNDADPLVAILGRQIGINLLGLRKARADQLLATANLLSSDLGPRLESNAYTARFDEIAEHINILEALRRADPEKATADMVNAHTKLALALRDNRQRDAAFTAMRDFLEKANAVREAFSISQQT